ncbi:hypothetical protein G7046_g4477 [Stylonectria norvegica]|nr:hypothetical protein G7046_g4477 [Stylonectria norvegica]
MALADSPSLSPCMHLNSIHSSRASSWDPHLAERTRSPYITCSFSNPGHGDLAPGLDGFQLESINALATLDSINSLGLAWGKAFKPSVPSRMLPQMTTDSLTAGSQDSQHGSETRSKGPFKKWVSSIHRRASRRPLVWGADGTVTAYQSSDDTKHASPRKTRHEKSSSSSGSSFGFVSAVRSASVSLASVSAVTRSRRNAARSHAASRTDRSSRASLSGPRASEDSTLVGRATATMDAAAAHRSIMRRRILEELISTEESYIGDIHFLMKVYVNILASLPTLSTRMRASINNNLDAIVQLHDEILGGLHRVIPHSEYAQLDLQSPPPIPAKHELALQRRWSLDTDPDHKNGVGRAQNVHELLSDPQTAAEVAKIFSKKMNRFFIYKEYGAKYKMMLKDVASAYDAMPEWDINQRGLETLASALGPSKGKGHLSSKSRTIADLLVKPVQRVCRYPLLFSELLKYTPVADCPNSHMEIETTLNRLRETTTEINTATRDDRVKSTLEKTWLLQDRLVFPERKLDAASKNQIRAFGHIHLCGALHVCWPTKDRVKGQYMICLLYRDILCLASGGKIEPIYTIQACINLNEVRVEDVDGGRGLQCHTAPFSWKLVFESDHQLYELIMTGCTLQEEKVWRSRLHRPMAEDMKLRDVSRFSYLAMDIKSLGSMFGRRGSIARKISIHRATTVGPKSPLSQVVLKNTSAVRSGSNSPSPIINRSQSLLTTNSRVPILAPPRSERVRLEALLEDIWSRDILPFPGILQRTRSEHLVRSSASTMMRKLSVARSMTGSFSRRTGSLSQRYRDTKEAAANDGSLREQSRSGDDETDRDGSTESIATVVDEESKTGEGFGHELSRQHSAPPQLALAGNCDSALEVDESETVDTANAGDDVEEEAAGTPMLQVSSPNSPRQSPSPTSDKSASRGEAKENSSPLQVPKGRSRSLPWIRPGGSAKQEGKSSGFRSFFR